MIKNNNTLLENNTGQIKIWSTFIPILLWLPIILKNFGLMGALKTVFLPFTLINVLPVVPYILLLLMLLVRSHDNYSSKLFPRIMTLWMVSIILQIQNFVLDAFFAGTFESIETITLFTMIYVIPFIQLGDIAISFIPRPKRAEVTP